MLDKKMSKTDVENFLKDKGDFVQINYLTRFLKEQIGLDMKKFVYFKLARIYEKNGMFQDSAKMYENFAINSISFSEKIKYHIKESEIYIKAGLFEKADEAMRKAMSEANSTQRNEIYTAVKNFYKSQAEVYERNLKRNRATKIYEKLLEMRISDLEKKEIKEKLLELYKKLGRFEKFDLLKFGI